MAGHSKWSKVKRLKGALDVKRGTLFSKLAKEITVAARMGGGDPALNHRLRAAVQAARDQNMPNDNIERAIRRGSGDSGEAVLEELTYEGYAAGGVAMLVEAATDNKNRTAADVRSIFSRNHGRLAEPGSVAYLFDRKGRVVVTEESVEAGRLLELALECDAEEVQSEPGQSHVVTTAVDRLHLAADFLRTAGASVESQHLVFLPRTLALVDDESVAAQVLRLHDALEENDDVLHVHTNFDIPDEILTRLESV